MTEKYETLKEIEHQLAMARHHRRVIMGHARNICWALGLKWEGPDTKDVEDCAFGRITLEEMLGRINERKITDLSSIVIINAELEIGPG